MTWQHKAVRKFPHIVCMIFMLCSCGPSRYEPIRNVYRPAAPVIQGSHRVQPGDTLYSIAWRYNRDHEELARSNGISAPYRIYPGQLISLEPRARSAANSASAPASSPTRKSQTRYKKSQNDTKPVQEKVANQRDKKVSMIWQWPVTGPVIESYSLAGRINKGIDLAGRHGEPVHSAADGRVVYSGEGLVGYGNLVIIKHNDRYLSAYAHNSRILVNEGQSVKAGQKIAEIGSTGTSRDKLHFEIRRDGKPVNPMQYLPKR